MRVVVGGCRDAIDSYSKSGSDLFHYERERSCIKVECSDHSNDFSDSREENC